MTTVAQTPHSHGAVVPQASRAERFAAYDVAATDVRVETVGRDDRRLGEGGVPSDRVAAQAYSAFAKATVITVPEETRTGLATVTITGPGEGEVAYGHLQ